LRKGLFTVTIDANTNGCDRRFGAISTARVSQSVAIWCLLVSAVTLLPSRVAAGDWPQILGPLRNGSAEGESLSPWSSTGPPIQWTQDVGQGYAGVAVRNNRVVVFHRVDSLERVQAFDAQTGKSLWKADFPAGYRGGINPDTGPRCVPLVHAEKVYVFGAAGDLHCVSLSDGQTVWSRETAGDFNALEGYFGIGSTPIVVGDKLLVNVGGRDEAGLVAFALDSGQTLWSSTDERASYSSPTQATFAGTPHAIFVTRLNTMLIDPASGAVRAKFPFGQRGPTVNAATPLVFGDRLFVTASYGIGATLARLDERGLSEIWSSDDVMSSQYPTPVYHEGHLYGVHGREDVGVAELRCIHAETGKVRWSVPDFGMAHLILASNRLLIQTIDGRLILAEATPERFQSLVSTKISSAVTRALPALANGQLYVRANSGDGGKLTCYRLDGR
jgi:outer membrane protein assembly factor BamB